MRPSPFVAGARYERIVFEKPAQEFADQFCVRTPTGGLRFEGPKTADGRSYLVHLNYQAHGPYGPMQSIEFLGYLVTVWAKGPGVPRAAHETVKTAEEVEAAIERLAAKADAFCGHVNAKQTGYANCYTTYRCLDCGETFAVDSSG